MKPKSINAFEQSGQDLLNLALKLDSNNKMEELGGQKKLPPVLRARHDAIMAMGTMIRVVSILFKC